MLLHARLVILCALAPLADAARAASRADKREDSRREDTREDTRENYVSEATLEVDVATGAGSSSNPPHHKKSSSMTSSIPISC